MKSLAAMTAAISLFVAGCVAIPISKPGDTGPGARPAPLTEGTPPSFEMNDRGAKLKHGKAALLPEDWGKDYLKACIQSFPPEVRNVIFDGISRHHTRHDQVEGSILFEPVRRLSGPYARSPHVGLIGTLQPGKVNAWAKFHYHNDVWVFAESVKIITDGEAHQSRALKFNRDNYGGKVWETAVLDLSKRKNRDLIERIVFSKEAIVRFQGERYYFDLLVTARMREDMKAMLKAIDAINMAKEVQASISQPSASPLQRPEGVPGS